MPVMGYGNLGNGLVSYWGGIGNQATSGFLDPEIGRQKQQQASQFKLQESQQGFQGQQAAAQRGYEGAQAEAQRGFQGTQAEAQRQLEQGVAGQQTETARRAQDIGLQTAQLPYQFSRDMLARFTPQLDQAFSNLGGGFTADGTPNFPLVGGANTMQPKLPNNEVYSPGLVNQQINAAAAGNQQTAASQSRQAAAHTAGQGYGSRSPLLAALQAGIGSNAAASTADQSRLIRSNAAEANAKQGLAVGNLAEQQWSDFNQADIARRTANVNFQQNQRQNSLSLIQALLGFAQR